MSEKTIADVLDNLSGCAPHAWEIAVRQQTTEGIHSLVSSALASVACIVASIFVARNVIRWHADVKAVLVDKYGEDRADASRFWIVCGVGWVIWLSVFSSTAKDACEAAAKLSNPEYYAAKSILEAVK